jgi:hypothetical protein
LRHYTNLDRMSEKLRQLVHEFEWGRIDMIAQDEALRLKLQTRQSA